MIMTSMLPSYRSARGPQPWCFVVVVAAVVR
jgi:hypothetical protein